MYKQNLVLNNLKGLIYYETKPTNQPTNQPINQPTSQPTNQPTIHVAYGQIKSSRGSE